MDCFLARQPILDRQQQRIGYELLFRDGPDNWFKGVDANQASAELIANSSLWFDFQELLQGGYGFINTTLSVLQGEQIYCLPAANTVVEILESVVPDQELVELCRRLKRAGYRIALDDFTFHPHWEQVLPLVDWVKFDVLADPVETLGPQIAACRPYGVALLAEKVESREVFEAAVAAGFEYFQGYFFAKPSMMSKTVPSANRVHTLRLIGEIGKPQLDFRRIGLILTQDAALSYALLRFLNSAAFSFKSEIRSVQQAVVLLGESQLRRWCNLLLFQRLAENKPQQLTLQAAIRGQFCQAMCEPLQLWKRESEFYTAGLFSLMDALLDQPMAHVLLQLPLAGDIKANLLGTSEGALYHLLQAARALENADWSLCNASAAALSRDAATLQEVYGGSIRSAQSMMTALAF